MGSLSQVFRPVCVLFGDGGPLQAALVGRLEELGAQLAELPGVEPTHLFVLSADELGAALEAGRAQPKPPRVVLLSRRAMDTRTLRASGLPFTHCAAGPCIEERAGLALLRARVAGPLAALCGRLGLGHSRARFAPFAADELAFGLAHAAFNYTTLGRTLGPEELRFELANDREWGGPATRREDPRH